MNLSIGIDLSAWTRSLSSARSRIGNMAPANREVGKLLVDMVRQNFDTQGGNGPTWPSLAPSTLIARAMNPSGKDDISAAGGGAHKVFNRNGKVSKSAARVMASAKPLIWSRALYRSIQFVATADYVDVGSPLLHSRRLFFGWTGAGPQTPARFPFRFRVGDKEKISRIFISHIFRGGVVK
jgi:hypothetical protein